MPKHYKHFIKRQNLFLKGDEVFPENIKELSVNHIKEIKETLSCWMSPENLHCDGEASKQEVDDKLEHYHMLCIEINVNTPFNISLNELEY
jgi:hypothetical protein